MLKIDVNTMVRAGAIDAATAAGAVYGPVFELINVEE